MSVAARATTARDWSSERAIDLWIAFGPVQRFEAARGDGALVVTVIDERPDAFVVFDLMRAAGVDDVRRVGVLAFTSGQIEAGRRAGAGAVVAVRGHADPLLLLLAEPDTIVEEDELVELYTDRFSSTRLRRRHVLLNPGPALTTDGVKRAAGGTDLCHREPEYTALEQHVRRKLRSVAGVGDDWGVALIAGSGTAADELAVTASVRPARTLLVVSNGVYGERILEIARRHRIDTVTVGAEWTQPVTAEMVAAVLDRSDTIDAVALVHHETTTGLLNPLAAIAREAHSRDVRVVVDAVSSFGLEEVVLQEAGIDFLACSSNKLLHGLPGAAFVLVSAAGRARAAESEPGSLYLDLANYLRVEHTGSVPFTPAIPALAALSQALDELIAEGGIDARRSRYRRRVAVLDKAFAELGLEQLIAEADRSHSIRTVRLPDGVSYDSLHDRLKRDGYVIYGGQGPLATEAFRVSCMGALEPEALQGFADRLAAALAVERVPA